jgi:hypothetical protein
MVWVILLMVYATAGNTELVHVDHYVHHSVVLYETVIGIEIVSWLE